MSSRCRRAPMRCRPIMTEDRNGEVTMNALGLPVEGLGFSNDAPFPLQRAGVSVRDVPVGARWAAGVRLIPSLPLLRRGLRQTYTHPQYWQATLLKGGDPVSHCLQRSRSRSPGHRSPLWWRPANPKRQRLRPSNNGRSRGSRPEAFVVSELRLMASSPRPYAVTGPHNFSSCSAHGEHPRLRAPAEGRTHRLRGG